MMNYEEMSIGDLETEVKQHEADVKRLDRLRAAAIKARDWAQMTELDALRGRSVDRLTFARAYLFKRGAQLA